MAIEYDLYTIPHPDSEVNEEIFYVRIVKAEVVSSDRLASEIEYGSSLTVGDITGAISLLNNRIATYLRNGKRVHIEGLGYFQLSITAPAVKNPKKMRGDYIQVRGVNFRPDKEFMAKLKDVKFERRSEKLHSQKLTGEEVLELLEKHFTKRPFITRAEFQNLCGFTKSMALKWIHKLMEEKILIKTGSFNSSVYEYKGND